MKHLLAFGFACASAVPASEIFDARCCDADSYIPIAGRQQASCLALKNAYRGNLCCSQSCGDVDEFPYEYDILDYGRMGRMLGLTEPVHDLESYAKQIGKDLLVGEFENGVVAMHRHTNNGTVWSDILFATMENIRQYEDENGFSHLKTPYSTGPYDTNLLNYWEHSIWNTSRHVFFDYECRGKSDYYNLERVKSWRDHVAAFSSVASQADFLQQIGYDPPPYITHLLGDWREVIFISRGANFTEEMVNPKYWSESELLTQEDVDAAVLAAYKDVPKDLFTLEQTKDILFSLSQLTRITTLTTIPYGIIVDADTGKVQYRQNGGLFVGGIDYR